MAQFDTRPSAMVAGETPSAGFAVRGLPGAAFLTQLIAERQHLPPQRARRRAPVDEVLRVYDAGGRIDQRRVPPGYRTAIDA